MIAIQLDESNEGIEVYVDAGGVDELIRYLEYVKSNNEHFHLVAGNELQDETLNGSNKLIKHAKLVFVET